MRKNKHTLAVKLCMSLFVGIFLSVSVLTSATAISNQTIVELTNTERRAAGLHALSWNSQLSSSAFAKANDMCKRDYWSHTAPDGTTAWNLIDQTSYVYIDAGENLAKGYSTAAQTVAGWMASPTHRSNILKAAFKDVGVASVSCDNSVNNAVITVAHYGAEATQKVTTKKAEAPKTSPRSVTTPKTPVSDTTKTPKVEQESTENKQATQQQTPEVQEEQDLPKSLWQLLSITIDFKVIELL